MKSHIARTLFIGTITFLVISCNPSKEKILHNFRVATNQFDKQIVQEFLDENFYYYESGKISLSKSEFLNTQDSLSKLENWTKIISFQDLDSVIITKEEISNIIDSVLDINPKINLITSYRFHKGKIASISVDSVINYPDFIISRNIKMVPFLYYVKDQHDIRDENEIFKNIKKYLNEFNTLPASDKKRYKTISYLQGTFISDDKIFPKIEFKGKRTAIVYVMGYWPLTTSYEVDEEYIKIKGDSGDLLLRVEGSNLLVGEGLASGTYKKVN